MSRLRPMLKCPFCEGENLKPTFRYETPPRGETQYDFDGDYSRRYLECEVCDHWFADHELDLSDLYSGDYVEATYGDRLRATYDRIMSLPDGKSDNKGRVARVVKFTEIHLDPALRPWRLLDIGSGLAVFPAAMRREGWQCTAIDPDQGAVEHARSVAQVSAIQADFRTLDHTKLETFNLVTLNKVLEHVEAPVDMLQKVPDLLHEDGILYVEVPDVAAAAEGPGREEFFVEHHHVFSPASLALMIERTRSLSVLSIQRYRDPSGKFTLCAFARMRSQPT